MAAPQTASLSALPAKIALQIFKLGGDGARIIEVGLEDKSQPRFPIGEVKLVSQFAWGCSQFGLVLLLEDEEEEKKDIYLKSDEDIVFVPAPPLDPLTRVAMPPPSYLWDVVARMSDESLYTIETLAIDLDVVCNAALNMTVTLYLPLLQFRALKKLIIISKGFSRNITSPSAVGKPLGVDYCFDELDLVLPNRNNHPEHYKLDNWLAIARDDVRRLALSDREWKKPEVVMMAKTIRP